MTTITKSAIGQRLPELISEYPDDKYCLLELLRFLGRHPHTRFSRLVIVHALYSRGLCTERALRYLVGRGVVRAHVDNDVPLYSLTEDKSLRSLALDLAEFDWPRWQLVLKGV